MQSTPYQVECPIRILQTTSTHKQRNIKKIDHEHTNEMATMLANKYMQNKEWLGNSEQLRK